MVDDHRLNPLSRSSAISRREWLARDGCLTVSRPPAPPVRPAPGQPGSGSTYIPDTEEIFVAILDDDRIVAFNGHVDLGTGIRTSLAQIVAEELDVPAERVEMVLGHSSVVPNQGPTIASATIQLSAVPLRCAAAQARRALLELAAAHFDVSIDALLCDNGSIGLRGTADTIGDARGRMSFGALLRNKRVALSIDLTVATKDPGQYKVIGRSTPRVDLPAKACGELTFVHDMRVPGMLHGRVIRPPYAGHDSGPFVGNTLLEVDEQSVATLAGNVRVVRIGDFVGVVADREEQAIRAAKTLRLRWRALPTMPDMRDPGRAIRQAPAQHRPLQQQGDVDTANARSDVTTLSRVYEWPYQMHASIGPSCALADYAGSERSWTDGNDRADDSGSGEQNAKHRITVWAGTQNPQSLRHDLSRLVNVDESQIDIVRLEAAGCYGRNCADDVAGDALLLSRAVGAPVRVQLSRADEHLWEPKGTAQVMTVTGSVSADGHATGYDFNTRYPSNDAPLLALLLTNTIDATPRIFEMGDRTAVTPYRFSDTRFACDDLAPLVRSSWLRGVSAMPNAFAHDAFIDELAMAADEDPLAFRLAHLDDTRAADLLRAVGTRAGWKSGDNGRRAKRASLPYDANDADDADAVVVSGRGVAYARYIHSRFPGFGAAWSAWIVDLDVNCDSGEITIRRVTVGQDTGTMINPDGVRHQIHGNVIQTVSRVLKERVRFTDGMVASREWGSYPMLTFPELPDIDVVLMPRQGEPPLGAGESASVPGPAAIANALFDATGVRFYAPPFTPEVVRAALAINPPDAASSLRRRTAGHSRR